MIIALILFLLAGFLFAYYYNDLIGKKNRITQTMGNIDIVLKKRYDLIQNLVATLQQYTGYEKGVLTEVTALRSRAMAAGLSDEEKMKLNSELSRSLSGMIATAENYPQLKADTQFTSLSEELKNIEQQLATARLNYNYDVTRYNNTVEMFPSNMVASYMKFELKNLLEIRDDEKGDVRVKDLFKG